MQHKTFYQSPLGGMILASDEEGLIGLWFKNQTYEGCLLEADACEKVDEYLQDAITWLNLYFSGQKPDYRPQLHLIGTPFQLQVYQALLTIPYGQTVTYGDLARHVGKPRAFQAIGHAVGHNPIALIVPCHRVVGKNGALTGYAGGILKKQALLALEHNHLKERKERL